ncbi:MAG: hypothetical protein DYG89_44700 [Caldilinea sp. CFX5]|nr:hypothetical protein [Caldilinea sp. CFX5]
METGEAPHNSAIGWRRIGGWSAILLRRVAAMKGNNENRWLVAPIGSKGQKRQCLIQSNGASAFPHRL